MKWKMMRILCSLLVAALMVGLVPGMNMTALAANARNSSTTKLNALASTGNAYSAYLVGPNDTGGTLYNKVVTFAGYEWLLIGDNSTSPTSGTVTLLMDNSLGLSPFNNSEYDGNKYSTSKVRENLLNYLTSNKNLLAVSDTINPVTVVTYENSSDNVEYDRTPVGDKLWLLSESEALALPEEARVCGKTIDNKPHFQIRHNTYV